MKVWVSARNMQGWETRFRADLVTDVTDTSHGDHPGCVVSLQGRSETLLLSESGPEISGRIQDAIERARLS